MGAVEEPGQDQEVLDILGTADYGFTTLFAFEMVGKIFVLGFALGPTYQAGANLNGPYLRDNWNILDGLVVIASTVALAQGLEAMTSSPGIDRAIGLSLPADQDVLDR